MQKKLSYMNEIVQKSHVYHKYCNISLVKNIISKIL
jgi:hypothetical protein